MFSAMSLLSVASSKFSVLFRTFTFVVLLLTFVKTNASDTLCDPNDPTSCQFGGVCGEHPSVTGTERVFVCKCPDINCIAEGLNPICDTEEVTYFNDVCRRKNECTQQRNITARCEGSCGSSDCKVITNPPRPCHADQEGYCLNFGQCLLDDSGRRHCSCLKGYEGNRCQNVKPQTPRATGTSDNGKEEAVVKYAEFNYRIAFLCMLGLLGLVLLLQVIYCVIKCYSRKKQPLDFNDVTIPVTPIEEKPRSPNSGTRISTLSISRSTNVGMDV